MKNSKNVLYVGGFELPDKNAAAQRVLTNGKLFSKLGYKVSYIGIDNERKNMNISKEIINIDGFQFNSWKQNYPNSKKDWLQFITSLKFVKNIVTNELKENVQIIVAYNYPAITLWKLKKFCKKNNIKLIADVTEWYQPEGNFLFKIIKGFDSYLRMNYLQKKVNGIIAISEYLNSFYQTVNCIEIPPLVDKSSTKWKQLPFEEKKIRKLIYVGSPGNGQKDKLDSVIISLSKIKNNVKDFQLTIVGITKQDYLFSFGLNSIPSNVINNIVFKGRKSHLESIELIKEADFSIFIRENNLINTAGFPTKFVESISCGTPVLTNSTSNIKKFLKEGELGFLIDTTSNESMDKSLVLALNQDDERIIDMKKKCYSFPMFHYEFYVDNFKYFLNNLDT
ncbi:glycosyltransferase [Lutibacter sp.]|uniref:glycosyltransferase n=1 Tax=Lutibacter sp. TaxID=1925666 RepID=UPI003565D8DB